MRLSLCPAILIICSIYAAQCNIEYFSSVDALQKLGDIELELVHVFKDFLKMKQQEFANFRKFVDNVKVQHKLARNDTEAYLGNPINSFTMIKRMISDWQQMHELVILDAPRRALLETLSQIDEIIKLPGDDELRGAISGLVRLQKVYDLQAVDLADGYINGVSYDTQLSWKDCFVIATTIYDTHDLPFAISWFEIALELLEQHENEPEYEKYHLDIMEYLAISLHELGDHEKAKEYVEEIANEAPKHLARAIQSYIRYNTSNTVRLQQASLNYDFKNYSRLCQGKQIPEEINHKLQCKLETKNNPYFILAPLKMEELSLDPEITMYYDIVTDKHINDVMEESADNFFRSGVRHGPNTVVNDLRVSQQLWLDYITPTTKFFSRITGEITGLDMSNKENMQVANYGIGGQYTPHPDFLNEPPRPFDPWKGDRLMTVMFYLSDVEQGGYTVFPFLNIYAKPAKGALVSWYNLHTSLDLDHRLLHAGCPVIKGSKRISNIWIHSFNQDVKRPCELQRDDWKSLYLA